MKDLNCIVYDNLDINKCINILNKSFKLLKYIKYKKISELSIIYAIIINIINKCKENYKKEKNDYSLKIINIISKQFGKINNLNMNNKNYCFYINRVINNIIDLNNSENKINYKILI